MKSSKVLFIGLGASVLMLLLVKSFNFVGHEPIVDPKAEAILVPTIIGEAASDAVFSQGDHSIGIEAVDSMSVLEVQEALQAATKDLQAKKDEISQASSSEVHHTHPSIVDAAARLADVMDLEARHPERKREFQAFYSDCARNDQVITVTRAQCLKQYMESAHPEDARQTQLLSELPASVVNLYKNL